MVSMLSQRLGRYDFRLSRMFLALTLLTAVSCTATQSRDPAAGVTTPPRFDWTTRLAGDTIVVLLTDATGFYRVEQVTLLGPAGQRIEAHELSRKSYSGRGSYGPGVSAGVGIGSRSGVGIGFSFFSFPITSSRPSDRRGRETEAIVRLADRDRYLREVDRWRISVDLTDPSGNPSTAEIPAPRPAGG